MLVVTFGLLAEWDAVDGDRITIPFFGSFPGEPILDIRLNWLQAPTLGISVPCYLDVFDIRWS